MTFDSALDDAVALLAAAFLGAALAAAGAAALIAAPEAGAPSTAAMAAALAGAVLPVFLGPSRGLAAVAALAVLAILLGPSDTARAPDQPRAIEDPAPRTDASYGSRLASVSSMIGMPSRTG